MREHNPDVLVVLSSGFSKVENLQELKDHGLVGLVSKPSGNFRLHFPTT